VWSAAAENCVVKKDRQRTGKYDCESGLLRTCVLGLPNYSFEIFPLFSCWVDCGCLAYGHACWWIQRARFQNRTLVKICLGMDQTSVQWIKRRAIRMAAISSVGTQRSSH
jgi:hypothetical protein